jgi:hypothetical protein
MNRTIFVIVLFAIELNSAKRGGLMALDYPIDITSTLDKQQFEAVVQYILDKGDIWEYYSQLWGSSPCLSVNDFILLLLPALLF